MRNPIACALWIIALWTLISCARPAVVAGADEKPLDVDNHKQLFIDHRFIQSHENIRLVVNCPIKRPGAVIRSDKPWDAFMLTYCSIAEDDGVYKMWYQAYDQVVWHEGSMPRMCYAVSKDGLRWEKPSLGIVQYDGSKDNNILLEGQQFHLASVFIDPVAAPSQRYKMIFGTRSHSRVGTSGDGIHWTLPDHAVTTLPPKWDTQKLAWWDQRIGKYVVHFRILAGDGANLPYPFVSPIPSNPPVAAPKMIRPGRMIGRLEMDDITQPWPDEQSQTVLAADERDPSDSDIYHHNAYAYPYADDAYFMFPMTYRHFQKGEGHPVNDGVNDTQFAASRDGVHWMRYDRKPYISRGLPDEPDAGIVHATAYHIRRGNYLYQYYHGWPWTHGGFRNLAQAEQLDHQNWGRGYYAVVIQRLDGFVAAEAPYDGAWLVTPPLVFSGSRLELNIDVAALGDAGVEIQDAGGEPIPGFTLADCDRILSNDVAHVVRWQGQSDISHLVGQPIRLKIVMRSAKLFAFQFNN